MIQSDVWAHPPVEPPEHPDEARAREEAMGERRALSKCPVCGYHAFNGQECFDCGYRP